MEANENQVIRKQKNQTAGNRSISASPSDDLLSEDESMSTESDGEGSYDSHSDVNTTISEETTYSNNEDASSAQSDQPSESSGIVSSLSHELESEFGCSPEGNSSDYEKDSESDNCGSLICGSSTIFSDSGGESSVHNDDNSGSSLVYDDSGDASDGSSATGNHLSFKM